jgi:hypothetical protein
MRPPLSLLIRKADASSSLPLISTQMLLFSPY